MTLEEICLPIKKELAQVEQIVQQNITSSVSFVTDIAEYVIRNGGKRLRPALCLFSSRLAGATGPQVIDCAAAMEFFHTATLMHDDVIDNAELRRGKSSANSRWGNHVSVLVGDFFYCQASKLLVGTGNLRIIKQITQTMLATTEGEILEISKSKDLETTEEDYLQVIINKTAVLMASSCAVGGILANISEDFIAALAEYGKYLGIAFQLADDVLDYISDEVEFGKVRGTDLKEGKLTLPLIVALKRCHKDERRLIKDSLIAENLEERHLREVVSLITRYQGIEETLKLARSYVDRARDALQPFKPSLEKETLQSLAHYVIHRRQ